MPPISNKAMSNKAIAAQLKEAARLLDVLDEDAVRARAYLAAARSIESHEEDVWPLLTSGRLTSLRGVGQGLARELSKLETEAELPTLTDLTARIPGGVLELFRVSGLGGKKVGALWRGGVSSLIELVAAAEDGRLAGFKGFGTKSAASILEAARFALSAKKRLRLDVAEALCAVLEALLPEADLHPSGSFRRRLETVGTLELVGTGMSAAQMAQALEVQGALVEVAASRVRAEVQGRTLCITSVPVQRLGAALLYGTGNAEYRQMLLARAEGSGLELRPEGLFRDGEALPTPTEADAYAALGLEPVPPELRERPDAVSVPGLITLADITGLIHNHSTYSDAVHSLWDMAAATRALGYRYFGTGDHSPSSFYANGLSVERLLAQGEEVRAIRERLRGEGSDFEVLHGAEVDIRPDGSLDYPDEVLTVLDYAVVSVHQQFQLSRADQTRRIIRAVEHPRATILGHMTGRLLLRRPSYDLDIHAVLRACAETSTIVEINASPYRLDLDWRWVRVGLELGCRFALNPDAHSVDGLGDVRFGVDMARKAGLSSDDVLNTAPSGAALLAQLKTAR